MERIVEQNLLYDFYGELLTEHQKEIFGEHVLNDMTPTEIALSAKLNTGRKNSKSPPPTNGTHSGQVPCINGKWNMSTTLPCKNVSYPPPSGNNTAIVKGVDSEKISP